MTMMIAIVIIMLMHTKASSATPLTSCARPADPNFVGSETPGTSYPNPALCTDSNFPICDPITLLCKACRDSLGVGLADCDCDVGYYCGSTSTPNEGRCVKIDVIGHACMNPNIFYTGVFSLSTTLYTLANDNKNFCGVVNTDNSGNLVVDWIGACIGGVCRECDGTLFVPKASPAHDNPPPCALGAIGIRTCGGTGMPYDLLASSPLNSNPGQNVVPSPNGFFTMDPDTLSFASDSLATATCDPTTNPGQFNGPARYCKNNAYQTL